MKNIEWQLVVNGDFYEVSSTGQVRSLTRVVNTGRGGTRVVHGKTLKPILKRNGYFYVKINGKQRAIHALVLESFVGSCPLGMQACHNDGNRFNNNLDNLRWGTPQSNANDKTQHGTVIRGERAHSSKLTAQQVLDIRKDNRPRNVVCKDYGITPEAVSHIVLRKNWAWLA